MLEGIDISRWQTVTPSLRGLAFVFVKATQGTAGDWLYAHHAADVRSAGLVLGAYHFADPMIAPTKQAAKFLEVAGTADLLALDLEAANMSDSQAKAFIAAIHTAGRKIGVYHSDSGYPSLGQDWRWVANWSKAPDHAWTFWQYTGSPLDHDRFNGDLAALRRLCDAPPDTSTGDAVSNLAIANEAFRNIRVRAGAPVFDLAGKQIGTVAEQADRQILYEVTVDAGTTLFYVCRLPGGAPGPDVLLVPRSDCTDLGSACPPPPPDTSPFTQADIDKAIAADRAKATVKVVWE